jgi:uncharacterized membrane protein YgcG
LLVALASAPGIRAAEPEVSDGGAFFSHEAVSEATDVILTIQSLHDRDVRVETYAEVPEELKAELERAGRDKFYDDWLNRRAKELGVRGVFILVTRTPGRVQVGVDRATQRRAFTPDDREALREALVAAFRAKRYDQGLLDGLRFIRRRLDENTARDRSPIVPVVGAVTVASKT